MFCGYQSRVGDRKPTAKLQSKAASQAGELFCDYVVFFYLFLVSLNVFYFDDRPRGPGHKKNEAVDQAFGCLQAHVRLLFDIFVGEALHLILHQLDADSLLGLTRRHQNDQLLA